MSVRIKIKDVSNTEICIELPSDSYILTLKALINQRKPELTPQRQSIIFQGCELQNKQKISFYGLTDDSVCYLITHPPKRNGIQSMTSSQPGSK